VAVFAAITLLQPGETIDYTPPVRRFLLVLLACVVAVAAGLGAGAPKTIGVWVVDTEGAESLLVT
jgi:hypothetical protein